MRVLVTFYSLTGTTRRVAQTLAAELGADIEEIHCRKYGPGFFGFLQACYASWRNNIPEIEPPVRNVSDYDLVLVGGPVWAWNACTPIRAYLMREAARLPTVAFFVTAGGAGMERALATMKALAGNKSYGTLALRRDDFRRGKDRSAIASFTAALR
jgi:Flavodoxin